MVRTIIIGLCLLCFTLPPSADGQTADKGTVSVRVIDTKTGETLPGANVIIKGTYYGGSSNVNGMVLLERVNPGTYTLEITLLGYKPVQVTGFKVGPGATVTFTARMEETVLTLDKDIVIIGEKPLATTALSVSISRTV